MNRVTVILVALAVLVAHAVAIHQTPAGEFAPPYEIAHVAYRVGRNVVHDGTAAWNPGGEAYESYPSPLWVAVSAAIERVYVSPTTTSQWIGILCALATVVTLAQFSPSRLSGMIAPLLVATSGSAAAAATSGTEAPLAMFLCTLAFLAFERRWRAVFVPVLALVLLARPEGAALILAFVLLELFDRPRPDSPTARPSLGAALVWVVVLALGLAVLRWVRTDSWLSRFEWDLVSGSSERSALGARYVAGFVLASGSGALIVLPILDGLVLGLTATARRALALFVAWAIAVALSGGDGLPYWNALAPVVPLLFLAVQETLTRWLDRRPRLAPAMWGLLVLGTGASLLVSKSPGDVGPIPLERLQRAWMHPDPALADAWGREYGRAGLLEEIREVKRLRPLGLFLRDRVREPATIATFWPGAIGYLSRKPVIDLLGRTTPAPGELAPTSWRGLPRVDLVASLAVEADYVIPIMEALGPDTTPVEYLRRILRLYDTIGPTDERLLQLLEALVRYELVSVPVPEEGASSGSSSTLPFLILRKKALGLAPQIELVLEGRDFKVLMRHEGHHQVADLQISVRDSAGETWTLRPTGEFERRPGLDARTDLLVFATGQRWVCLVRGKVPETIDAREIGARLHNPGTPAEAPLAPVGAAVSASFEPR
jgi:hypothetical protein